MTITYIPPIPIDAEIELKAHLAKIGKRSRVVACSVSVDGKEHTRGEVTLKCMWLAWSHSEVCKVPNYLKGFDHQKHFIKAI